MKRLLLIVSCLLLMINVQAQDNSNTAKTHDHGHGHGMWIGGSVGYGTLSEKDYTIAPSWGMMFGDNLGGGITVSYSADDKTDVWGIEPYIRYYIPVVDNFKFYGDGFVGFEGWNTDKDNDDDDTNGNNTYFGVRAGLQYWFTPKWSVAASTNILQYDSNNGNDGGNGDGDSELGIGLDFSSVNLSLFFHF